MSGRLSDIKLPENWSIEKLSKFAKIKMGQSPPSSTYNKSEIGLPFFQGNIDFRYLNPTASTWCNKPLRKAKTNDILISVRAPVGEINIADQDCAIGRGLAAIEVSDKTITKYVYFALEQYKSIFRRLEQGSTFKAINKSDLTNFPLVLPKIKDEQHKIATILSTVDEAIRTLQQLIEAKQTFKRGLMQRLFSRGIGHTEFKDSEFGSIPKEWKMIKIKLIGEVLTGQTPSTKVKEYWDKREVPFITPGDISDKLYVEDYERYVSKKGANNGRIIPKNSILAVCIGSTVGKMALNRDLCITNQQINSIVLKPNVDPIFTYYSLSKTFNVLKSYAGKTAVPIIKKSLFENFKIAIPGLDEQMKISSILGILESELNVLNLQTANYRTLKKGLMQQLLTGKIRVKVN